MASRTLLPAVALLLTVSVTARAEPAKFVRYGQPLIAITHARLVDGTGAAPRADVTLIIRQGRIASVTPSAAVKLPKDARVIDWRGKTVLPGFVMMHEHMFYPTGNFQFGEMLETFPRLYLAGGTTTLRTAGTLSAYADLNLRAAIEQGATLGPEVHVTGPYVEGVGLPIFKVHGLKNPDETERFVNYWADEGVTSFKAYMLLSRAMLGRAIATAHRRGIKVTGHLCSVTYREAAELGIDNLEHGFGVMTDFVKDKKPDVCPMEALPHLLDEVDPDSPAVRALIGLLVERKVALTSTLQVFETLTAGRPKLNERALSVLLPELRQQYETNWAEVQKGDAQADAAKFAKMMRLERLFVAAGGTLLAGTDPTGIGGTLPGFAAARQIELLLESGFPLEQAIQIATLNGARFLKRDQEIGSVEAGKRADLVLLDGDPLTDRQALERMPVVFKAGVGYDTAAIIDSVRNTVGLH